MTTDKRGSKVGPQCSEPLPLLDRYLLTVKDSELCPLPSVNSLQLSIIKPYSFLLTWESPDTNMTGLKGFIVAYHRLDTNDQVYVVTDRVPEILWARKFKKFQAKKLVKSNNSISR